MFLHTQAWNCGMLECAGMLSCMLTHRKVHLWMLEWLGNERCSYARKKKRCLRVEKWTCGMLECAGMLSSLLCA